MIDRKELGDILRALRVENKLTFDALADITKLPVRTLKSIEYGEVAASFEKVQIIFAVYGAHIEIKRK